MSYNTFTTFTCIPSKAIATASRTDAPSIILPYMPESLGGTERSIFMAFISAFREGPHRRMELRILTAIQKAADITENSDAYVSRVLVDMGLMAPRIAFPGDFLDHVDATLLRDMPLRTIPASYSALTRHWAMIGEDLYAINATLKARSEGRLQSFLATV